MTPRIQFETHMVLVLDFELNFVLVFVEVATGGPFTELLLASQCFCLVLRLPKGEQSSLQFEFGHLVSVDVKLG